MGKFFLIFILSLVFPSLVSAATLVVPTDYQTIQAAVDAASAGDEIHIGNSTYSESVTVDVENLTLAGESTSGVIISVGTSGTGISVLANYVTIKNITVDQNGDGISIDNVSGITIQDSVITNNTFATSGISILDSSNISITGNTITGNFIGIDLTGSASGVTATGNVFGSNTDYDIANNTTNNATATGNTWNTSSGIFVPKILGQVVYDLTTPSVNAGPDKVANAGFTQNATASDAYGISSYFWEKVSGSGTLTFSNPAVEDPNVSAGADGVYSIKLTVTDTSGNTNSDIFQLTWDTIAPTLASKTTFSGWYTANQTSVFTYSDSGSASCVIATEGMAQTCSVTPNVCDAAGNCNTTLVTSNSADIDKTKPSSAPTSPATGYYNTGTWPGKVAGTAADSVSGVNRADLSPFDGIGYWNSINWTGSQTWFTASGTSLWEYLYTPNKDGEFTFYSRATDNATNVESTGTLSGVVYDTTPPTGSWTAPASGETISGSTALAAAATDSLSGVDSVKFQYKRNDGVDVFHDITTLWNTTGLILDTYILRAIITDKAGNSTTVDETVEVAAVVTEQSSSTTATNSFTIAWTTDRPTSGYVVYDTVGHTVLSSTPSYGYAFTSPTVDASPKTTTHTVVLSGLSANTQYFWRSVSFGSPTAVGPEYSSRTFSEASAGGGGGGGGGGGNPTVNTSPAVPPVPAAVLGLATEEVEEEILPTPTPEASPIPSPTPEVRGASTFNFNWWLVIIPTALLGLIISGLLLWRRT